MANIVEWSSCVFGYERVSVPSGDNELQHTTRILENKMGSSGMVINEIGHIIDIIVQDYPTIVCSGMFRDFAFRKRF